MLKPLIWTIIALIGLIGVVLVVREYGKTRAASAQAKAEQARMAGLLGILRGHQQQQLVETQTEATAKDWLGGIQAVGEVVAVIAGSETGGGAAASA